MESALMMVPPKRAASVERSAALAARGRPGDEDCCDFAQGDYVTGTATKRRPPLASESRRRMDFRPDFLMAATRSITSCGSFTLVCVTSTITSPGFTSFCAAGLAGSTSVTTTPSIDWPMPYCSRSAVGERRDGEAEQRLLHGRLLGRRLARRGGVFDFRFGILGQTANGDVDGHVLALAQQIDHDRLADRGGGHRTRQTAHGLDRLTVEFQDHVARLNAGGGGGALGRDGGNERAFGLFQAEALGDLAGHVLHAHAEPAAPRLAILLELVDHLHGAVRWAQRSRCQSSRRTAR